MGAVTFCRLTQYQYDSLVTKNPDAVYLTSDSRMLYVGAGNYSHGTSGKGHVIGGYPELLSIAGKCRFLDCRHTGELGCCVDESGISEGRLARYREFLDIIEKSEKRYGK